MMMMRITVVMVLPRSTIRRGKHTKGKSTNSTNRRTDRRTDTLMMNLVMRNRRTNTLMMNLVMRKRQNRNTKRKQKEIKQIPKR